MGGPVKQGIAIDHFSWLTVNLPCTVLERKFGKLRREFVGLDDRAGIKLSGKVTALRDQTRLVAPAQTTIARTPERHARNGAMATLGRCSRALGFRLTHERLALWQPLDVTADRPKQVFNEWYRRRIFLLSEEDPSGPLAPSYCIRTTRTQYTCTPCFAGQHISVDSRLHGRPGQTTRFGHS
jgi:hypothetical protein